MAAPISPDNKVPQGMIVVDRFGDRDRYAKRATLGEGDRLAYPPALNLEYGHDRIHMFGGTIPVFEPDKKLSAEANQRRYVDWMIEQDKNEKVLFEAIFYLSQNEEGRQLLSEARARGFKFVFDRRTTEEANANALCDFENKLIPISPNTNPIQLMYTLAHELDHMHVIGKGLANNTHQTFTGFIKASRALEGAARTREAGIAYGFEQTPAHYFKPPGVTEFFAWKLPHMAAAARQALKQGHAISSDGFRRDVFMGFYKETDTLAYYDKYALGIFETRLQELQKMPDPAKRKAELGAFMGKDSQSHSEVLVALPYLKDAPDVATSTFAKLLPNQDIKDRHAALAEAMKTAYDGADVTARVGAAFDEPEPVKPTLMSIAGAKLLKWFPARAAAKSTNTEPRVARPAILAAETPKTIVMPSQPTLEHAGYSDGSISFFAKNVGDFTVNYRNPNDILLGAMMADVHHMHKQGFIRELIGLGLRAPISAFPFEYVTDLCAGIRHGAGKKGVPMNSNDIAIFTHWKMLAAKGVDPFDGSYKGAIMDYNEPWAKELAGVIGEVKKEKAPLEHVNRENLVAWVRAQKALAPERSAAPAAIRVASHHGRH